MQFLGKYREAGLLLLRVSIGALFLILVAPVLTGGHAQWTRFGGGMRYLGIHSHLQAWGFAGALLVCLAAVLIVFGLFFRLGILLCLVVAVVCAISIVKGTGLGVALRSIELCLVLASLLFIGPGNTASTKRKAIWPFPFSYSRSTLADRAV